MNDQPSIAFKIARGAGVQEYALKAMKLVQSDEGFYYLLVKIGRTIFGNYSETWGEAGILLDHRSIGGTVTLQLHASGGTVAEAITVHDSLDDAVKAVGLRHYGIFDYDTGGLIRTGSN
jgi:hypothetical protein